MGCVELIIVAFTHKILSRDISWTKAIPSEIFLGLLHLRKSYWWCALWTLVLYYMFAVHVYIPCGKLEYVYDSCVFLFSSLFFLFSPSLYLLIPFLFFWLYFVRKSPHVAFFFPELFLKTEKEWHYAKGTGVTNNMTYLLLGTFVLFCFVLVFYGGNYDWCKLLQINFLSQS